MYIWGGVSNFARPPISQQAIFIQLLSARKYTHFPQNLACERKCISLSTFHRQQVHMPLTVLQQIIAWEHVCISFSVNSCLRAHKDQMFSRTFVCKHMGWWISLPLSRSSRLVIWNSMFQISLTYSFDFRIVDWKKWIPGSDNNELHFFLKWLEFSEFNGADYYYFFF